MVDQAWILFTVESPCLEESFMATSAARDTESGFSPALATVSWLW